MEHLIHQIAGTRKWRYELPNFMPTSLAHQVVLVEKINTLSTVLSGESYRQGKKTEVLLRKQKKKKSRVKKLVLLRKRINNWVRFYHWNVVATTVPGKKVCMVYRGKKVSKWTSLLLQYWQLVKSFRWRKTWWKSLGNIIRTPRRSSKLWWKIVKKRKPKRKPFKKKLLRLKKRKTIKPVKAQKRGKGIRLKTKWSWKFPKKWMMWDNSWYRSWKRVGIVSYRSLKLHSGMIYNGMTISPLVTSWWEMDYDESVKARFVRKTTKSGKVQKRVNGVIQIQ
jgi:hypothetical protein